MYLGISDIPDLFLDIMYLGISDIPDLFDIGLSKETLRRYIGLKTTDNPDPKFGTSNTLNVPDDTKTTEYQVGDMYVTHLRSTGLPTKDKTVKTTCNSINKTLPTLNYVFCHKYIVFERSLNDWSMKETNLQLQGILNIGKQTVLISYSRP